MSPTVPSISRHSTSSTVMFQALILFYVHTHYTHRHTYDKCHCMFGCTKISFSEPLLQECTNTWALTGRKLAFLYHLIVYCLSRWCRLWPKAFVVCNYKSHYLASAKQRYYMLVQVLCFIVYHIRAIHSERPSVNLPHYLHSFTLTLSSRCLMRVFCHNWKSVGLQHWSMEILDWVEFTVNVQMIGMGCVWFSWAHSQGTMWSSNHSHELNAPILMWSGACANARKSFSSLFHVICYFILGKEKGGEKISKDITNWIKFNKENERMMIWKVDAKNRA